jgi:hypothetical protein
VSAKSTKSSGAKVSGPGSSGPATPGAASALRTQAQQSDKDKDVALVCGVSEDGQSLDIIRKRGERIETGTVRRLEEGKPIHGEVVRLRPREHAPFVCDVEVEVPAPSRSASPTTSGPAQVATETYRKNWDAIYGPTRKQRALMN